MMSTEDSRQHRRSAVQARCIARAALDGRLLSDSTLDVSYSGVRLAALGRAQLGERVELSLELPGSRVWIEASGKIERVIAGRRAGDEGPALGVRVDRMDGMKRLLLAQVASGYPEVPRSRGARRDYVLSVLRIGASD